jgi:predicted nucleic acid-binding protein
LDLVIADDDDVAVAAVTIAELRVGVLLSTARARSARQAFFDDVVEAIPVLVYDQAVAEAHADLLVHVRRHGTPRGAHDLIIAATAKASGRTVVSADSSAFGALPGVHVRPHR